MSNETGSQALATPGASMMGMMGKMSPANMELVAKQVTLQMVKVQMALSFPRDIATVQSQLLAYCSNPDFARAAVYAKPVGGSKKYGLSARFAEAAAPVMRNLYEETTQIYDDPDKQTWRVLVGDLETNSSFSEEVFVNKRVWRKSLRRDADYIQTRINTNGEVNYLYEASDDEVNTMRAALCSKVRRNLIIRHVPPDVRAKCLSLCLDIAEREDAKDPDAARKQIVDSFLKMGIGSEDLAAYLGHSIRAISEGELSELRGVYAVVRDGEALWADLLSEKQAALAEARKGGNLQKVKDRVKENQKGRETKKNQQGSGDAQQGNQQPSEEKKPDGEGGSGGRRRASRRRGDETPPPTDEKKETPTTEGQPSSDSTPPADGGTTGPNEKD